MLVYWIRTLGHTDPYTEGYVGITTKKDPYQRLKEHQYSKEYVGKAVRKHNVIVDVIFEGSVQQCVDKEIEYRPHTNIGWNIASGGGVPPRVTEEAAKKISETHKKLGTNPYNSEKTHSPDAIAKRKATMVGKKWYYNPQDPTQRTLATKCPTGWIEGRVPAKPIKKRGQDYICNVSSWKLTDPSGIEHIVFNLKDWCRDMGLTYLGPHSGKTWRGWYIKKL